MNRFPCSEPNCTKVFLSRSGRYRHIKDKHREKRYSCKYNCGKLYSTLTPLLRHERICSLGHPIGHGITTQLIEENISLSKDMKKNRVNQFPCSEPNCNKVFLSRSGRNRHIKDKHREKRYSCKYNCGKLYSTPTPLLHHERTCSLGHPIGYGITTQLVEENILLSKDI